MDEEIHGIHYIGKKEETESVFFLINMPCATGGSHRAECVKVHSTDLVFDADRVTSEDSYEKTISHTVKVTNKKILNANTDVVIARKTKP